MIFKKIALVCALIFGAMQFSTKVDGIVITTGVLATAGAVTAGLGLAAGALTLGGTVVTSLLGSIFGD